MANHDDYASGDNHGSYEYNSSSMVVAATFDINPVTPQPTDSHRGFRAGALSELDDGRVIYNSYAGVDIVASFILPNEPPMEIGELQTISYSMHRENLPVRLLGHSAPVGFVKGSRTIGGSMIFTVFNNYAFYRLAHFREAVANRLYPVADMLPPVDVLLTFANEYGVFSKMRIFGLTFVDEGGAMSIDDLISESTLSFMARGIQPLTGHAEPHELRAR